MDFKKLNDDQRAVSPVIGVILMVAITVILAAVIGTFVLGLGDQVQSTTPQASFDWDTAGNSGDVTQVTVTHQSGSSISVDAVSITATTPIAQTSGGSGSSSWAWSDVGTASSGEITAGSSATVYAPGTGNLNGATIRVIYNEAGSDSTTTLAKFEVPE